MQAARSGRRILVLAAAAWSCAVAAEVRAQAVVYVADLRAGSVAVVDPASGRVTGRIPVGADPDGLALSGDRSRLYVSNFASGTVSVIDTATRTVVATVPVGTGPVGLALSPAATELWVTNKTSSSLSIVDTGSATPVATIPLAPGAGPNAVAFAPGGGRAYVTNSRAGSVSVVDTLTRTVVDTVAVQRGPSRVVVHPTLPLAFVGNFNARSISVIDTDAGEEASTIEVDLQVSGLALTADGGRLYAAGYDGVRAIDVATLTTLPFVEGFLRNGSSRAAAVTTDGRFAYVSSLDEDTLSVVDIAQNRVVASLCLDSGPFDVTVGAAPEQAALAWITQPLHGSKVHTGNLEPVRITVRAGSEPLLQWRLGLVAPSGARRELASGSEAVGDEPVATIDGRTLDEKGAYELLLEVETPGVSNARTLHQQAPRETTGPSAPLRAGRPRSAGGLATSRVRVTAPDPRFALLPLDDGDAPVALQRPVIDRAGRTVAVLENEYTVALLEIVTGARHRVSTNDDIRCCDDNLAVSADAATVAFIRAGGALELVGAVSGFSPFPYLRGFSLDASGARLALTALVPGSDTDGLKLAHVYYDHEAGEARVLTPVGAVAATPRDSYLPLISGDARTIAFASTSVLYDAPPDPSVRWRVYAYDVESRMPRYVAGLPAEIEFTRAFRYPTLSDDGRWLGFASSQPGQPGVFNAALLDLQSGVLESPLAQLDGFQAFDAVVTPDGSGIVVSTVADLDPAVGNADGNAELFLLERDSGGFTQITETVGDAYAAYAPTVSVDGRSVALTLSAGGAGACAASGPQRDEATGLYLGSVYSVPRRAGNQPPELAPIADVTVALYQSFELALDAADADGDRIVYFVQQRGLTRLPDGARVDERPDGRTVFGWQPLDGQAGSYDLRVAAFDVGGDFALRDFTLLVCDVVAPGGGCAPTPTPSETPTEVPTSTATATRTPSATGTPSATVTASTTATAPPSSTATPTRTASATQTATETATHTPTTAPGGGGGGCHAGASSSPRGALAAALLLTLPLARGRRHNPECGVKRRSGSDRG